MSRPPISRDHRVETQLELAGRLQLAINLDFRRGYTSVVHAGQADRQTHLLSFEYEVRRRVLAADQVPCDQNVRVVDKQTGQFAVGVLDDLTTGR